MRNKNVKKPLGLIGLRTAPLGGTFPLAAALPGGGSLALVQGASPKPRHYKDCQRQSQQLCFLSVSGTVCCPGPAAAVNSRSPGHGESRPARTNPYIVYGFSRQ